MSQTLADKAYNLIKKDIISCELSPGQHIRQSELAKRSAIGMTPIREALQRLSLEGLVHAIPNSGYMISPITLRDVREIYELRLTLEPLAARLASERGSDEQFEELCVIADFSYVHHDQQSYTNYLTLNRDFHCRIADISQNRRLARQIARLLDESTRLFHFTIHLKDRASAMREEHIQLASVISSREADRAEQLALTQIESSQRRVQTAIMSPGSQFPLSLTAE